MTSKPKSWRDVLEIHPAAELFPMMSVDELQALSEDIKKRGLHEGLALLDGKLLDGRNRLDAMEMGGIKLVTGSGQPEWANIPFRNVKGKDPVAYAISKNIHRRHLTGEQKRELIEELMKATPEKSNRQIAKMAKVDHKTVAAVRAKKEARGEIPHVATHTDSKGRKQAAHKSPAKKSHAPTKPVAGISTSSIARAISTAVDQVADAVPELPDKPAVMEVLTEPEQPDDPISLWTEEVHSCVAAGTWSR